MRRRNLERGVLSNGMAFGRSGDGERTAMVIPGGPGNDIPKGTGPRLMMRQYAALVEAGFTVWQVTREQDMPNGHSIDGMADDYAEVIDTEFGGNVELVVGISYGGLIAQFDQAACGDSSS